MGNGGVEAPCGCRGQRGKPQRAPCVVPQCVRDEGLSPLGGFDIWKKRSTCSSEARSHWFTPSVVRSLKGWWGRSLVGGSELKRPVRGALGCCEGPAHQRKHVFLCRRHCNISIRTRLWFCAPTWSTAGRADEGGALRKRLHRLTDLLLLVTEVGHPRALGGVVLFCKEHI